MMTNTTTTTTAGTAADGGGTGRVLTERFTRAFDLARRLHPEARKLTKRQAGTRAPIPYITHPMRVAATALAYGGTEDDAIAGLLHDTVEDAGGEVRLVHLRLEFGDVVADIVQSLSDSTVEDRTQKKDWWERKVGYLHHLEHDDVRPGAFLVCAADKVANLEDTLDELRVYGIDTWSIFKHTGRDGQLWYYRRIVEVLRARVTDPDARRLVDRLEVLVASLKVAIISNPEEGMTEADLEAAYEASCTTASSVLDRLT